MATVEVRVCDVFKTAKDVQEVRLRIQTSDSDDHFTEYVCDMGPRALKRLEKFAARAFAVPNGKKKKDD